MVTIIHGKMQDNRKLLIIIIKLLIIMKLLRLGWEVMLHPPYRLHHQITIYLDHCRTP